MSSIRQRFLANAARWHEAAGDVPVNHGGDDAEAARRAVAGEVGFRHIGVTFFRVGRRDIDWSGGHHQHQEWPAQLNRFFHLRSLAAAWRREHDAPYAEAAADYIRDWLRANPTRPDWRLAPADNTLNLTIRVQCWLANLPDLQDSPAFDDALLEAMFASMAAQMNYLRDHLSRVGNWRIAEAAGLLTAGVVLDWQPDATARRTLAVDVLNDALNRQVLPDGVHMERNPSYHDWMRAEFERFWWIGRAMPELGLAIPAEVVARMHDYSLAVRRPNGQLNSLHDSHGFLAGRRPADWAEARRRFRREAGFEDTLPPTAQFFPDAGQVLLRDGWDEDATYVVFDGSTWGGCHCHLGANAVQIHAFGRTLLPDAGSLTYEGSDPLMAHGGNTWISQCKLLAPSILRFQQRH
jgi:hypothetical protein